MEIFIGLGIWLVVAFVLATACFFAGRAYFRSVMGFESRKLLIRWGLTAVALSGTAFFFLPLLVADLHVKETKVEVGRLMLPEGLQSLAQNFNDATNSVMQSTVVSVAGMVEQAFLWVSAVGTCLVLVGVVAIIVLTREKPARGAVPYQRSHVFEFHKDCVEKLNKDYTGR